MRRKTMLGVVALLLVGCMVLVWTTGKKYLFCSEGWLAAPDELVADYEYLAIGRLAWVDTLLDLGSADWHGFGTTAVVVEYAFQTEEILKGRDEKVSMIYLWYCSTTESPTGYSDRLKNATSQPVLVYGNVIDGPENIALVYTHRLRGRYRSVKEIPLDDYSAHAYCEEEVDSTFLSRIMVSNELPSMLNKRRTTGVVVYVHGLFELSSYYRGRLMYRNEEYLQEVRKILKKPGA